MPTFILTLNWTEQGIHAVKDAPKRSQAAKELAKKLGVAPAALALDGKKLAAFSAAAGDVCTPVSA